VNVTATTTATAAVDKHETETTQDEVLQLSMDTADSSAATIPSGRDVEERNKKIEKAINKYLISLAHDLSKTEDDLKGIVSSLRTRLKKDEFWKKTNELQKNTIEVTTTSFFEFHEILVESADVSRSLESLMTDLRLIKEEEFMEAEFNDPKVIANEFNSPYYNDPTGQVCQLFDYIKSCDKQFKDGLSSPDNNFYSPYISICQSSGWGKSRIMRQLSAEIPVLYLSYQHTKSKGYPIRTQKAIDFLNLKVDQDNNEMPLTNESYYRLLFAAQRYKTFWTKKREKMVEGRAEDVDAVNKFIGVVFNNPGFWKDVQQDWEKNQEDSKKSIFLTQQAGINKTNKAHLLSSYLTRLVDYWTKNQTKTFFWQ
jgi:hypothetical protein